MINTMCIDCYKYCKSCKGTECQTWTGCIYREAKIAGSIESKKAEALASLKAARSAYMENQSNENWVAFCDAKTLCRRLGALI